MMPPVLEDLNPKDLSEPLQEILKSKISPGAPTPEEYEKYEPTPVEAILHQWWVDKKHRRQYKHPLRLFALKHCYKQPILSLKLFLHSLR